MQHLEPHNLIEASPLFRGMPTREAEAVLARLQPAHYQREACILERGVWHGRLYLIASGQVSVLLADQPEQESQTTAADAPSPYVLARLGPGECFGEMSLITGEPPSATVRTEQDTSLWSLSQVDFLSLITICPTLLQNINSILSQRLVRTNQHLAAQHTAEISVLALLDTGHQALAAHIAAALAARSHRRVLLLELCGQDAASGQRFAAQQQERPSLLACYQDHTLLQVHRTSAPILDGQPLAAFAALTQTQEEAEAVDPGLLLLLSDLALLYDFIVPVVTQNTPPAIRSALLASCEAASPDGLKRVIQLVSASDPSQLTAWPALTQSSPRWTHSLFVTHTPEKPTIGAQDHYTQLLGHTVTRLLPADDSLLQQCWEQQKTLSQLAPSAPLTMGVDFVARFIAHQTIGIAFGGGAARGFAHIGVLERLLAHQIPLDYIAACSSGIIAPGMFLVGKSLVEIEEICLQIQQHLVKWNMPRTSLFSNRGLKRMLRDICGEQRFEDLTTPFAMVAADLTTRAGVVLERGLLWQAGLASVALPGIFPPVVLGEHILIDAGMHDPVPVRLVRKMGADILLASELGGQDPPALTSATPWLGQDAQTPTPHIIDVLLRTYDLAMATIGMHSVREADVVLRPKLYRVSLRQFSEGRKFISAGRDAVEDALPKLRQRLPWL